MFTSTENSHAPHNERVNMRSHRSAVKIQMDDRTRALLHFKASCSGGKRHKAILLCIQLRGWDYQQPPKHFLRSP
jgi:hypothetical protein